MKPIALILVSAALGLAAARGQNWPPYGASAQSRSGQFVVSGVEPGARRPFVPGAATNTTFIRLEPTLLTVSCERIKQALLSALQARDEWRGKIFVVLHPFRGEDEEITVTSTRFSGQWNYRVDLPDAVDPARLVQTLTQVLLLEMANRKAGEQSTQLPPWLAEGMPSYLLARRDLDLVIQPSPGAAPGLPVRSSVREGRLSDFFLQARKQLRGQVPLTIAELSRSPSAEEMQGEAGGIYRNNALLFVNELLQLKNGGACLYALLPELPWDPDWRVGFLKAFNPHFKREIVLEKWWALQSSYLAGRDPRRNWPRAESLAKLDEALRTPFEVRLGSNEPPLYTDVSLQAIIKGWKRERQIPALREKMNLLNNLQLRVAPELRNLVRQYHEVLAGYLNQMDKPAAKSIPFLFDRGPAGFIPARSYGTRIPLGNDAAVQRTLAQLDVLDERCARWKVTHDPLPEPGPGR
jgi:hypothetical protein